jgi:hypothetical protein
VGSRVGDKFLSSVDQATDRNSRNPETYQVSLLDLRRGLLHRVTRRATFTLEPPANATFPSPFGHSPMNTNGDRFWNSQGSIHPSAGSVLVEHDNARFT